MAIIEISDATDLQAMENDLSADYEVINHIDAESTDTWNWNEDRQVYEGFDPVGTFTGSFDGGGYVITRLHIDRYPSGVLGLFSVNATDGSISRIGLKECWVHGRSVLGILCGRNEGRIWDSWAEDQNPARAEGVFGEETAMNFAIIIGGLVGRNRTLSGTKKGGKIWGCYTKNVGVRGQGQIGGFVGGNIGYGKLWANYSDGGAVIASRTYSGGFVGRNGGYAEIRDCYSTMEVSSTSTRVGGLVGNNANDATIHTSYSIGSVTGSNLVGGLVGEQSNDAETHNSFWDKETSGRSASSSGTGKTTIEMQDITTYTDVATAGLNKPWDIADLTEHINEIWGIDDGNDYPILLNPQKPPFVGQVYVRKEGVAVLSPISVRTAGTAFECEVHVK